MGDLIYTGPKRFPLGLIVATPGALERFSGDHLAACLQRHASGDWGDLSSDDKEANEVGLANDRLLSSYVREGRKLYIITEHDRSVTTLLLPEEY